MKESNKLAGVKIQLVIEGPLKVELNAMHRGIDRTTSGGNGSGTRRSGLGCSRRGRRNTKLGAGGTGGNSRQGRVRKSEIQGLGEIFAYRRLTSERSSSNSSSNGNCGGLGNHGRFSPCRYGRNGTHRVLVGHRARSRAMGLLALLHDGCWNTLSLDTEWVAGIGALSSRWAFPSASSRSTAGHGSTSAGSGHRESQGGTLAGTLLESVPVRKKLRDGSKTDTGSLGVGSRHLRLGRGRRRGRRLVPHSGRGKHTATSNGSVKLLIVLLESLALKLLATSGEEQEDEQANQEKSAQDAKGNSGLGTSTRTTARRRG